MKSMALHCFLKIDGLKFIQDFWKKLDNFNFLQSQKVQNFFIWYFNIKLDTLYHFSEHLQCEPDY